MEALPTLYLIVGLPGAGKTTRARQLEVANRALRLSPDEWMVPLFGTADADGKRDVLVGDAEQRRRIEVRSTGASAADIESADDRLDEFRVLFEPPGRDELGKGPVDDPPADFDSWESWAVKRWPSFVP